MSGPELADLLHDAITVRRPGSTNQSCSLRELIVDSNNLGDAGVLRLADVLARSRLRLLSFVSCGETTAVLEAFANAMEQNETCVALHFNTVANPSSSDPYSSRRKLSISRSQRPSSTVSSAQSRNMKIMHDAALLDSGTPHRSRRRNSEKGRQRLRRSIRRCQPWPGSCSLSLSLSYFCFPCSHCFALMSLTTITGPSDR